MAVGTAKVQIEADFSDFESDLKNFFGKAGDSAGDALEKGTRGGVEGAVDAVGDLAGEVEDAAGQIDGALSKAGEKGAQGLAQNLSGVSDAADKEAAEAAGAFDGLAGDVAGAGAEAARGFSVSIDGVSSSAAEAATGVSGSFASVAGVGGRAGGEISGGFSAAMSGITQAASNVAQGVSNAFSQVSQSASYHFGNMRQAAEDSLSQMSGAVSSFAGAAAAILGVAGAREIMGNAFAKNTSIEDTTAALTVMRGSASEAEKIMEDLKESNMQTPYAFDAWAGAGKTLLAFGDDAEKVAAHVTALGEAASATGRGTEAMDSMARSMGQALSTGKITMDTINQLAAGGVNGLTILANEFGVTTEEMSKKISSGGVEAKKGIDILMTGIMEGSKGAAGETTALEGTMQAMSQTTSGVLANMGAAFNNLGSGILDFVFPAIKVVGQAVTDATYVVLGFVRNMQQGTGVWVAVRYAVLGVAGAFTVFLLPAIAAVASAVASKLGAGLFTGAIKGAWSFWFAAGGGGQPAGVIRTIASVGLQWARTAVLATVNAAKAGAAWLLAAPKNPLVIARAFATMIGGWVRTGAVAMVNAVKIAAAWVVASGGAILVVAAIAGVIAAVVVLWNKFEGFRNFFTGLWNGLVSVVSAAWGMISGAVQAGWEAIVGFFTSGGVAGVLESAKNMFTGLWDAITTGAQAVWEFLQPIGETLGGFFVTSVEAIANAFMWFWNTVLQPLFSWISNTWSQLSETLGPAFSWIGEKLAALGGFLSDLWANHLGPMFEKLVGMIRDVGAAIGSFIAEHWTVLKPILIALGAVLLAPIVVALGLLAAAIAAVVAIVGVVIAVITGFVKLLVALPGWVSSAVTAIGGWFKGMWDGVKKVWDNMTRAIADWFNNTLAPLPGKVGEKLGEVIGWFKRLPGRIKQTFVGAASWLFSAGQDIVRGLMNGLGSLAGQIGQFFLDKLPGWIQTPFKKALGIASPSRLFMEYGRNIGEGLVMGVDSMGAQVEGATNALAGRAANVPAASVAVGAPAAPAAGMSMDGPPVEPGALQGMFTELDAAVLASADGVFAPAMQGMTTEAQAMVWQGVDPALGQVRAGMDATGLNARLVGATAWAPALAGMRAEADYLAINAQVNAGSRINPALQSVANTSWRVLNTGVNPALANMRGAVAWTASSFAQGANNIAAHWSRVREATAAPVRFAINTVFNDGLRGMWNSASDLLGTPKMAPFVARFATGGHVRGPGGPKDDKIPALLSDGEYVVNAAAVKKIGVQNMHALNSGHVGAAPGILRDRQERKAMLGDATFRAIASRYAGGGIVEGSPAARALMRGVMWARSRHGRPYVFGGSAHGSGGTDCSGFMSGIADVILGGSGRRQWGTGNFPASQAGAWAPGLASGFAVGITNGGPGGGHTAGTIGGTAGIPAYNVESGGSPSMVKFVNGAVGANDSYFNTHFHMKVLGGERFKPGAGSGGADMGQIIGDVMKPHRDRARNAARAYAASGSGLMRLVPQAVEEKLGSAIEKKIDEEMQKMMGDPGGEGVARWAPMVRRALAWTGFPVNDRNVRLMLAQIASESGGIPNRAQEIVDVNGTGASAGLGLLQIIPTTFAAYRDPRLPNDRTNPFANMVAALRYYRATYGDDLGVMWGKGHGYDRGGLITEKGLFSKQTTQAERVLSPRQTRSFEELTDILDRGLIDDVFNDRAAGGRARGGAVRTIEVTQNFHAPMDAEKVGRVVENKLAGGAW